MRYLLIFVLTVGVLGCGGSEPVAEAPLAEETAPAADPDGSAQAASEVIQQEVERIRAENEEPATPQVDPMMEERCAEVPQSEMDRVEAMMTQLDRETVMLTGDDMLALGCSRYQQYLRGELSSY
jgi:hypothetical protein